MPSPIASPERSKALALLAANTPVKAILEAIPGLKEGTLRYWKSRAEREARQAQQAGQAAAVQVVTALPSGNAASATTSPSEDSAGLARKRKRALAILNAAAAGATYRGKPISQAQRDAAAKILAATKPRASEGQGASDEASVYRGMHEAQLLEMWLVSGCTVYGIARVKERLAALEAQGLLDAGGPSYPTPPLLGGEPKQ